MNNASIGIKLADGSFYPILTEGTPSKKKLELTTVRDLQTTVQINLYKSTTDEMQNAEYVGTLIIENLIPHEKQEPTIDLLVSLNEDNVLSAEALDRESGNHNGLQVVLTKLSENELYDYPDFAFQDNPIINSDSEDEDTATQDTLDSFDATLYTDIPEPKKASKKGLLWIILGAAVLALILALVLFFTGKIDTGLTSEETLISEPPPAEPVITETIKIEMTERPPEAEQIPPAQPVTAKDNTADENAQAQENKVVVIDSPVVVPAKPTPVSPDKIKEVQYKVKWGDTLWDIANAYYKNPWLYSIIARANGIKNPNVIVSGTYIVIPPR